MDHFYVLKKIGATPDLFYMNGDQVYLTLSLENAYHFCSVETARDFRDTCLINSKDFTIAEVRTVVVDVEEEV